MSHSNPFHRWLTSLLRTGAPASYLLLGVAFAFFVALWLLSGGPAAARLLDSLVFEAPDGLSKPWTMLTYVLANPGPGAILGVVIGLFFFGSSLERSYGTARFLKFFFGITLLTAAMGALGAFVLGIGFLIWSMGIPVACVVVAWATRNPGASVLLWFVLPIKAVWIGWMAFVFTLVSFTYHQPGMAVFLAVPFVVSWAYAAGKLLVPNLRVGRSRGKQMETDYEGLDWERRREAEAERRRLKELFERSWKDDPDIEGPSKDR